MARYLWLGDAAITVEFGSDVSPELNQQVRAFCQTVWADPPAGFLELIPTYRSATVLFEPRSAPAVEAHLRELEQRSGATEAPPGKLHVMPVHYGGEDGPDLKEVAAINALTPEGVVALHAEREYTVYGIGFSPGFLYLGGLPPELHTPRLGTPRTRVPAGSVGIGGQQTGVYPIATPGGWRLLGRTTFPLFDVNTDPPSPVQPGDRVLFKPVSELPPGETAKMEALIEISGRPVLEVLRPGLFTTVQDLGRWGYQAYGVSVAGAMDPLALRAANAAVGNEPGAGALELTITGPTLRALAPCTLALAGAAMDLRVNGQPTASPAPLRPGDVIEVGRASEGARAYLAIAGGGVDVPLVLGSRSTYTRAGFGGFHGRPLATGDVLASPVNFLSAGPGVGCKMVTHDVPLPTGDTVTARVVLGPQNDHFPPETIAEFVAAEFTISSDSDRMGYRLSGHPLRHAGPAEIVSDGVVVGSIQVPPHGNPIVMLADRPSMGGYPKIATVVSTDVRLIAQARPGMKLRFRLEPDSFPTEGIRGLAADMRRVGAGILDIRSGELRLRLTRHGYP